MRASANGKERVNASIDNRKGVDAEIAQEIRNHAGELHEKRGIR